MIAVCIATHNRREELARTLASLAALDPPPDEWLIAADGCTDGTVTFVREHYPQARLIEHAVAQGSIPSRNEMAAACTSEIFLSIDDDSYPMERDFLARVAAIFAARPRLAVLSFPQRSDEFPASLSATDFGPEQYIGSYANSGAAIRRAAFLELGGYPPFFFHQYEEPDFALRCVAAGWQVWQSNALTIRHHFTGVQRNEVRSHHRHSRNEFWSVLLRCPAPQCFAVIAFRIVRQLGYAWKRGLGWVLKEPLWWWAAAGGIGRCLALRRPLPWSRYLAWMRLVRRPMTDDAEWDAAFGGTDG